MALHRARALSTTPIIIKVDRVFANWVDTDVAVLTLTPSSAEVQEHSDTATVLLTLDASQSLEQGGGDTATIALSLTPSAAELTEYSDTETVLLTLTPSISEVVSLSTTGTVLLTLTPQATEFATIGDTATVLLTLSPSKSVEIRVISDHLLVGVMSMRWSANFVGDRWSATAQFRLTGTAQRRWHTTYKGRGLLT